MFRRALVGIALLGGLTVGCPDPQKPTPLEEHGDWVDAGPLASCFVREDSGDACGELSSFNLDQCDRNFGAFDPGGSYVVHKRYVDQDARLIAFAPSSIHLDPAGVRTEYIDGNPQLNRRQFDDQTFYLGRRSALQDGTPIVRAYAGCEAVSAEKIVGCFARCQNGQVVQRGTFEALNVRRAAGESEASGLTLLAERPVPYLQDPTFSFGLPVDVFVTKNRAYVVSVDWGILGNGGLSVFDVTDPANPVMTAQVPSDDESGTGTYWNGVWAKDDALYVASGEQGVITFDISNPDAPVRGPVQVSEPINVHTVFVRDNHLFAQQPADLGGKVLIYDVTAPLAPSLVSRYVVNEALSDPSAYPHDAFVYQGRMYVNWWSAGYRIIDVTNPANPVELGAYEYPHSTSHANAVGTFDGRLIAFEGGEDWGAHLRVLDVTDPAHPTLIGEYRKRPELSIHNMVLDEAKKRLYIAYYQEGVRVLDVADPANPVELAYFNTYRPTDPHRGSSFYDGAIGIRVPGDGRVYVIDTSRGLMIFNEP